MNKLFGLFLLALACWAPSTADAAARFAVCSTTCTWDNTSTAMWSTSTGGATGASAPVAGDTVTLDAATCVGGTTCTITTFAGTIAVDSITWGACTASTTGCIVAANTNNTNFTLGGNIGSAVFNGSGTGTRKWTGGTGTYAVTQNNAFNNFISMGTTTNDQGSTFNSATWTFSGTANSNTRGWSGGGFSYGPTTFNASSTGGSISISGTNTFASIAVNGPLVLAFPTGVTTTITGALTLTGSSASAVVYINAGPNDGQGTISLGSASTGTWVAIRGIVTSGAAGLTATNCLNLGYSTLANGGTCTNAGSGGGGRIIGG